MDNTLLEELNKQINKELYSAYLYFGMSAYFMDINMEGFGKIIKEQAKEELNHAKRIYKYLIARDEKINLYPIEAPENNWINPTDAIKSALYHEKSVTCSIEKLYGISKEVKDYAGEIFLQWFITEQIEEEEKFRNLLSKMENLKNFDCETINIDRDLNKDIKNS